MIQCPHCGVYSDLGIIFVDIPGMCSGQEICEHCGKGYLFNYITIGKAFAKDVPKEEYYAFADKLYEIVDNLKED